MSTTDAPTKRFNSIVRRIHERLEKGKRGEPIIDDTTPTDATSATPTPPTTAAPPTQAELDDMELKEKRAALFNSLKKKMERRKKDAKNGKPITDDDTADGAMPASTTTFAPAVNADVVINNEAKKKAKDAKQAAEVEKAAATDAAELARKNLAAAQEVKPAKKVDDAVEVRVVRVVRVLCDFTLHSCARACVHVLVRGVPLSIVLVGWAYAC